MQSAKGFLRKTLAYGKHRGYPHSQLIAMSNGGWCINVGGGPTRDHFRYININLLPMPGVDVAGDAHRLPLRASCADLVVCNAVLEHVPDPWSVVAELERITKPSGTVYIEVPFLQHYHPSPEDYWRFTLTGLRHMCRNFEHLDSGIVNGPLVTLVEMVESYLHLLPLGVLSKPIKGAVRFGLYPLRWLEWLTMTKSAHTVSNGFYFCGRKPPISSTPKRES